MYYIRYRISGSQLLAAMDLSSSIPHSELLSARTGETSPILDKQEHVSSLFQGKEEASSRLDDRNGRTQQTVDVAEILRRWTHALQRIHKQSLHLVRYLTVLDFLLGVMLIGACLDYFATLSISSLESQLMNFFWLS